MLDFVLAAANVPFTAALVLMLTIGFFEGVGAIFGVGLSGFMGSLLPEINTSVEMEASEIGSQNALSRLLGWLMIGRVPLLMLLVIFLMAFGISGYVINLVALGIIERMLPGLLASPLALVTALPLTRGGAAILEAVMPRDESSSVSLETLIGREAFITLGQCTSVSPAEAKVRDQHGAMHYVMVIAEEGRGPFRPGMPLLLVRKEKNRFVVIEAEVPQGSRKD